MTFTRPISVLGLTICPAHGQVTTGMERGDQCLRLPKEAAQDRPPPLTQGVPAWMPQPRAQQVSLWVRLRDVAVFV